MGLRGPYDVRGKEHVVGASFFVYIVSDVVDTLFRPKCAVFHSLGFYLKKVIISRDKIRFLAMKSIVGSILPSDECLQ